MSKGRISETDFVIRYSLFDIQHSVGNLATAFWHLGRENQETGEKDH